MRHSDDPDYYTVRTIEEMERGDQAVNSTIAAVHYELAFRYSVLAGDMGEEGPAAIALPAANGQLAA
jgi:hypothetical protein